MYQSLLHLSWIDELLDNIKTIFVDLYTDQLKRPRTSIFECDFDPYFDQQLNALEGSVEKDLSQAISTANGRILPSSSDFGEDEVPPPIPGLLRGRSTSGVSRAT